MYLIRIVIFDLDLYPRAMYIYIYILWTVDCGDKHIFQSHTMIKDTPCGNNISALGFNNIKIP